MIDGISSNLSNLSSIYNTTGQDLASVMAKIAAGKKFILPSDDFVSYLRSAALQNESTNYDQTRESLVSAKVYTDAAQKIGNQVYSDLVQLKNLASNYTAADVTTKPSISAQFNALKTAIVSEMSNGNVNGTQLMQAGLLTTVNLSPTGSPLNITPTAVPNAGNIGAFNLTTGTVATDVDPEIQGALTYLSDVQSFGKVLDNQIALTDTIIASKNSAISAISGIDDAAMLAKETDLQLRQQAAVSMMAQAGVSRMYLGRLYGGGT
jgi:flagellin-like hook-associated protein FlgL